MSITLPPMIEAWDYTPGHMKAYAAAAVEADRASRVPLTVDQRVEDLAMLVKQLVRAVRSTSPDSDIAHKAMGYLHRNDLKGSPLRDAHHGIGSKQ